MADASFGGDQKVGRSALHRLDTWLVRHLLHRIPPWIETYHLTLCTILWSAGIIIAGALAAGDYRWLWVTSACIVLQYLTDLLDGKLGKARGTGLIRWGYYMDHFLDHVFLASIIIGYAMLMPLEHHRTLLIVLAVLGAFMTSTFLAFAATNAFRIEHLGIGPTEIRIGFIVINTLLVVFGKTYLAWSLPLALVGALSGLVVVVVRTQRELWRDDLARKAAAEERRS